MSIYQKKIFSENFTSKLIPRTKEQIEKMKEEDDWKEMKSDRHTIL